VFVGVLAKCGERRFENTSRATVGTTLFSCCDERFRKVFEAPRRIRRRLARLQYGRDGMAPGDGRGSGLAALTLPVQRLRRLGQLGAGAQADHRPHLLMKD